MREIIYKSDINLRLDTFLQNSYPLLNSGNINKFLRQNKIKLNGKKASAKEKLKNQDKINIYLAEDFFETPTKSTAFKFSNKNIDIVYEDNNILLVNKPSGVCVFDENWQNYDTLTNRVLNYYFKFDKQTSFTPALCHRIDTGTSGIVVFAKTEAALCFLLDLFKNRLFQKKYLCVCIGKPKKNHSLEKAYLLKNSDKGYVTIYNNKKSEHAKEIETGVTLVESYGNYSLLDIDLITGKTHQIRAHLAYLGLPILGDSRYGDNQINRKLKLKYQLLCSYSIKFPKIDNINFNYLSNKTFNVPYPWFVEGFNKREF